ncbi:MAG: AEC family transporter [Clostridia bacterium]|nr:AEC family transporter [Clostridia bacterium]
MISTLLLYKILQLALVMLLGFMLVKLRLIKTEDSTALSKISLYLLMPAAILNAFDVERTQEITKGLILAFAVAIVVHILLLIFDRIYLKLFKGTSTERASIIYSNAANLIIPIVSYVLGEEWVIYSCAFMSVQLIFLWTHGIQIFSSSEKISFRKILLNVNLIAIVIGGLLMFFGIRLPKFAKEVTSSLGSMIGTVGMLIAGILAANVDFKKMLKNKRLYLVLFMRMLVCPFLVLLLIKIIRANIDIVNADKILLISLLAAITPTAATIMQFAQIYKKDADFATAVNIVTTLVCIFSMPLFVLLYQI